MKTNILFTSLLMIMLIAGCENHKSHKSEEDVKFLVTSPLRMDTATTREYVCQIRAIQHIELRALERGYLEKIYVDEGQFVNKGQLMFQILPSIYQAEFKRAQAEANFAQIEYQNTKQLADSNVVAPNELALAEAKLAKAQAELIEAQVHLDFTTVRAPFAGIMDQFHVRLGSLLDEGDLLTSLSDNSQMWVYFNVPEAEYLDYRMKFKTDSAVEVRLRMANDQFFPHVGKVTTIEADFNNETGNIAFRATFPNPDFLLRHGETGNVVVRNPIKNALLIPQKSTFEVLDKQYVFVIGEDGVVHSRPIEILGELPHIYILRSGLEESDKILLEGLRKVRENQKINMDYLDPKEALTKLDLFAQ